MIHRNYGRFASLIAGVLLLGGFAVAARAQGSGAIDFAASARPAAARPEPIREMSFYLLRKSLADIRAEAEQAEHATDMNHFIDGLEFSAALKTWMKTHQMVDFVGQPFTSLLKADDIVDTPEFFDAYIKQNGASLGGGIPIPNDSSKEQKKNPEKYAQNKEKYKQLLRRYITANPDTIAGLDAALRDQNPGPRWNALQTQQQRNVVRRTMELAQSQYLAAKADSDLNGRGSFTGVAPGTYWITTLDTPALAGDAHLQWDLGVNVRAGETTHVELSNLNALESTNRTAQ